MVTSPASSVTSRLSGISGLWGDGGSLSAARVKDGLLREGSEFFISPKGVRKVYGNREMRSFPLRRSRGLQPAFSGHAADGFIYGFYLFIQLFEFGILPPYFRIAPARLKAKESLLLLHFGQFFLQIPYLAFQFLTHFPSSLAP